ncbi:MAG TPA: acyl-CoA thioester hydrolase/BAAT C-terminal domain-containing protein [Cyclobacteriaceae bacterium]|nr:acyl-CoA thioester hydrolase/BAAT C-terminal domain-containing protein [Cyclobacteriaceae bacterium]
MRKILLKFFLYSTLCVIVLLAIVFLIVYQEFGPVDHEKLISQKIRQKDLVADFFYPKNTKGLPLIIAVGGSGGGFLPEKEIQSLALNGYAVLSVAYFNVDGLPKKLENIPLEYFTSAITWAREHSVVDSSKIVALGVSRGAELALLLASLNPQIKGVVAYAPGCFILPNAVDTEDSIVTHSSWTWRKKPLPFAPLRVLQDDNQKIIVYRRYIEPLLKDHERNIYTINIENAKCPILMLSGGDDQTWPSAEMSKVLERRLTSRQYPYSIRNVTFPNAGHWLVQFQNNYQIISSTFRVVTLNLKGKQYQFNNGGSAWATMMARRKTRTETLKFLEQFK